MIEQYIKSRYVDGGRGPDEFDCWGLVRQARNELYGLPLLPSYGHVDKQNMHLYYELEAEKLVACRPKIGAIACMFKGRVCIHVALVVEIDNRIMVLSTSKQCGPYLQRLADFEARSTRVIYYSEPQ